MEYLTSNDYQPGLSGGEEFLQGWPTGLLGTGGDGGVRTSLLAAVVERDGGGVWWEGNRRRDLNRREVKLNSPGQLTDVILLHLEAIGAAGNEQLCLSTWPLTAPSPSRVKSGKRGTCYLCLGLLSWTPKVGTGCWVSKTDKRYLQRLFYSPQLDLGRRSLVAAGRSCSWLHAGVSRLTCIFLSLVLILWIRIHTWKD